MTTIETDLGPRGWRSGLENGEVVVVVHDAEVGREALLVLAQLCAEQPRAEWGPTVARYFDNVERSIADASVLAQQAMTLDGVRADLRLLFASSRVLEPTDFVIPGQDGVLVAVPDRHTALLHVIKDASVVEVLNTLLATVPRMFHESAGSVSPSVYWWRAGRGFMLLPVDEGRRTSCVLSARGARGDIERSGRVVVTERPTLLAPTTECSSQTGRDVTAAAVRPPRCRSRSRSRS